MPSNNPLEGSTVDMYSFDNSTDTTTDKGSDCKVMTEILLSRYDHFISHGMLTHITTNLNSEDIGKIYGARVRSRLREMMNLIVFTGQTHDKRI